MIKCEFLGKSGTACKYKVNERYIVYLRGYANCQNLVIDTMNEQENKLRQQGNTSTEIITVGKGRCLKNEEEEHKTQG